MRSIKQFGGSLVEVMVGLFVGTLVMMTVYETVSFMEANKRLTLSSNNTYANLLTGMSIIDRDIKMAGLGLSAKNVGSCALLNAYYNGVVLANGNTIAPVVIQSGGGAPDNFTTFYGNAITGGAPARVLTTMASATAPISISASADLQVGQLSLLMEPSATIPCTIVGVTGVTNVSNYLQISHTNADSLYNPANPATAYANPVIYTENAVALNLGSPTWQTWQVNNGRLETVNRFTGVANEVISDVVHMRAQYGVTNGTNDNLNQWVDATGEWAALDAAHIARIRAIRIALVARDPKPLKPSVSGGACDATTAGPIPWTGAAAIDLTGDPNWQCYRYQILKTIMPLKNVLWSASA